MITYQTGNILESSAEALVNTVNTEGVMGKGIALQFKKAFPSNFKAYAAACKAGQVAVGRLFLTKDSNLNTGERTIINFPTKQHWKKPSEYSYIEAGLDELVRVIAEKDIRSIAIPPLGSGNGGLDWQRVKQMIASKLGSLDVEVIVYEPTAHILEQLKKERAKLTDARALLLYVLYDLVRNGEYVSEFSSEKVCYFLQRFGAKQHFNLDFKPNFYGPYSGKVRFVLNALNGSYVMGYSDMDKKPFDPLTLVADGYADVVTHVESDSELKAIADRTVAFLTGFYSDFALELLSSIDFIVQEQGSFDHDTVTQRLATWSDRKRSMFSDPKYVAVSLSHLEQEFGNRG